MGEGAARRQMTAEDYLAWEREQLDKHEYHLGEVFAMAGGSPRHNCLSAAVMGELRAALRGKGCGVLTSDQRISAELRKRYVYADAVVVCDGMRMEPGTTDVLANPRMVVEVLSKSTEKYDRGDKWAAYQRLPSLTDYLLVAQEVVRVEHYQRQADGSWRYTLVEAGGIVVMANGASVSVDAVYEGAFEYAAD